MGRICGIVFPDVYQTKDNVEKMLKILSGPSAEYYDLYCRHAYQIGQTGYKLTVHPKQKLIVALDGCLYGQELLLKHFSRKGIVLRNQSDAHLIMKAYEVFGLKFLPWIDGDFAFAIIDKDAQKLVLARDRMGKKPLYWYQDQNNFIFASELKSLLKTDLVAQSVAPDAVAAYLALGYFPQDVTPIMGVNKLLPGYYLCLERDRSVGIEPYWSLSAAYTSGGTKDSNEEISSNIDALLKKSTSERTKGLEKAGCYLSGGLGSASVAYYVKNTEPKLEVSAYTSGFLGQNDQDVVAASLFAKSLKIPQKIKEIDSLEFLNNLVPAVWHLDEPLADPNLIATWELTKLSKGCGTVFSGMGSDELFAGHNRYTLMERQLTPWNRWMIRLRVTMKRFFIPLLMCVKKEEAFRMMQHSRINPFLVQYMYQNHLFSSRQLLEVSPHTAPLFDPDVFLKKFHHLFRVPNLVSAFIYLDLKTRMPDQYMLMYERFTHAQGVTWATPYLDRTVIEYAAKILEPEELHEQEIASFLKNLFMNVFPKQVVRRPKKFRYNFLSPWGRLSEFSHLLPLLKRGTLVETGMISSEWLDRVCATPESQRIAFRHLFSVLVLEIWFRLFINRAVGDKPPEISVRDLLMEP